MAVCAHILALYLYGRVLGRWHQTLERPLVSVDIGYNSVIKGRGD